MMANILIVDDEKSIRIFLRKLLRDGGYEVEVAEDADKAKGCWRWRISTWC